MDLVTRYVYILMVCFCLGHTADGDILDIMKNVVWRLTGNTILEYDQTSMYRRFVDEPDATPTWAAWHSDSSCTVSCGDGVTEYTRDCSTGSVHECEAVGGSYWKIDNCNNAPCGAHWLEWQVTKACSVTCGTGVQVRKRSCSTGTRRDCPEGKYFEFGTCNPRLCHTTTQAPATSSKVPAVWSAWSRPKPCSVSCGTGFTEKTRTCATGKDQDCAGQPWQVIPCTEKSCQVDGVWSAWSAYGSCSATCGPSQRSRSRTCTYPKPDSKGLACGGAGVETEKCTKTACAVDGRWGSWTTYSPCSTSCGQGYMFRSRSCNYQLGVPRGNPCVGDDFDTNTCMKQQCAVDGVWAAWSSWSTCTKSCGNGLMFRNRLCQYQSGKPHGKSCVGTNTDMRNCTKGVCPVDGVLSQWTSWSQCSHTCNGGLQARTRVCTFSTSAPRGKDCVGSLKENRDCGQQECAVDGTWGEWGAWAQCSETCGGGSTARRRTCEYKTLTAPHGRVCEGESFEKKNCSDTTCAVDGAWTTWTKFSRCSITCGTGQMYRTRQCQFDAFAPAGRNCSGVSLENRECHKRDCPVDGLLTEWGAWSICTTSCESGTQVRSRDCFFPANVSHGNDCDGALTELAHCNESPCPTTTTVMTTTTEATANGSWSSWGNWSACSQTCGTGSHTRSRTCTFPDHTQHGLYCPGSKTDTRNCSTNHCPVDGVWSSWSLFGRCSATCEDGTHTRTRTCTFNLRYPKGNPCSGNDTNSESCYAGLCPVDGSWDSWGAWSSCPVTCGGSVQERVRICEYPVIPHGDPCVGVSHENKTCGAEDCPVDGKLSEWTAWTDCPVTCGNGTHTRDRSCDFTPGARHGKNCIGELTQTQSCNDKLCPVDGVLTQWSDWGQCSLTCGGGLQHRARTCQFDQHAPHGKPCSGATSETSDCRTDKCPVDGIWGSWGPWSECSQSCEEGLHSRSRPCSFLNGYPKGKDCLGINNQTNPCNKGACPVDGKWSEWSTWTSCSASCGNGTKARDRQCDFKVGVPHGANCTGDSSELITCNTTMCPVDGQFGGWSEWTKCPVSCGGGLSTRHRSCGFDKVAPHGTNCTGDFSQSQNCSETMCPVDGTWSTWSPYTNCSRTCGNGTMFRKRKCEFKAGYPHGINCSGVDTESASCNPKLCPVDGHFSLWGNWSDCSKTCENGTQIRSRTCEFDARAPRGNDCVGDLSETQACNEELCPINSHWSNWTDYSTCSNTCGNGTHTRSRTCISHDPHPSSKCFGAANETSDCNDGPCSVDGSWSDWSSWSRCSDTCGSGKRSRGRICEFLHDKPKGDNCTGNNHQIEDCNTDSCPVDGTLTDWSLWSNCSVTCGDGVQFRTRRCDYPPRATKGKDCNASLSDSTACHESPCKVDGQWSDWSAWGTCDAQCGNGTKARTRSCEFKAGAPHGDDCAGLSNDTASCNETPCPVDGSWSQWSDFSACTKSCGNGTITRTRSCQFTLGVPHGANCSGDTQEVIRCNTTDCREDGVWSDWAAWSFCSMTCGEGNKTRSRSCTYPTSVHGNMCIGDSMEITLCNQTLCQVDGTWSNWSNYSTCSESCGDGIWTRTRNCNFDPIAPKGAPCPGSKKQQQSCKVADCTVDGVWSQWTSFSVCSQTCDNGTETRTRNCVFNPPTAPRGKNCSGDATESQVCTNGQDCPVDGSWEDWTSWSSCSVTCGSMQKHRSRDCVYDTLKPKGNACFGQANETVDCSLPVCAIDGQWGDWQAWQTCSVTCGKGGTRARIRTCNFASNAPKGQDCTGSANDSGTCDTQVDCPVSAFWDEWGRWSPCSVTCGSGTKNRRRQCVYPPHVTQGVYCHGKSRERDNCTENPCS